MKLTPHEIMKLLQLQPLPMEGGYYRETYRAGEQLAATALPSRYGRAKALATAIYYLLTPQTCSALHRLPTDEVFHFYLGSPVQMLQLLPNGQGQVLTLGTDLAGGQRPQVVVPHGVWQGAYLIPGGAFAMLGTTMAPGFDFSDYEPADRAALLAAYPNYADLICRLTPSSTAPAAITK
jgi:predicted cupin superfamily sugar epimerase